MLVKNQNFGQKSKFWPKIQILVKNQNFRQKSNFWSQIEILVNKYVCSISYIGENFSKNIFVAAQINPLQESIIFT